MQNRDNMTNNSINITTAAKNTLHQIGAIKANGLSNILRCGVFLVGIYVSRLIIEKIGKNEDVQLACLNAKAVPRYAFLL